MVTISGWLERFLQANGVPTADLASSAAAVRERARRYPFPAGPAYPVMEALAGTLAPSLLLRRPRHARGLDPEAFDRLDHALQSHDNPLVRLIHTLIRYPALEHLYPDPAPTAPSHPLEAAVRRGASHFERDFDVIVIGSGAGGAPVAWSLARRGLRVAIVESGALLRAESASDALERRYVDQGMVGSLVGRGMTLVLAGNAVGGTTVVNSGTSLRPLPSCLADWDAALGTRFAEGELDPWLDAVAQRIGITTPRRELLDSSAEIVERGLRSLGRDGAYVLPRNAPDCRGAGRCPFGCPNGAKLSTDRSFLPEAVEHGAVLLAETRAVEIREHVGGVEVFVRGPEGRRQLRARALVVAAGALATPDLLRNNRLGSRHKDAGHGLRIHPASKVFGMMPEPLERSGVPQGLGYRAPELPRVTFEGVHTPAGPAAPMLSLSGRRHRWWMERYDRLATFGMMVRDRASGWVRGVGQGRYMHYALDPADARDLGAGLLLTAEAMFAAGAERILLPISGGQAEVSDLAQLRRLRPEDFTPGNLLTCGFHPHGSAGMGRLVDRDLRLRGSQRIRVCDASVLPDSPGVNPQVTIMALALRLADHMATEL